MVADRPQARNFHRRYVADISSSMSGWDPAEGSTTGSKGSDGTNAKSGGDGLDGSDADGSNGDKPLGIRIQIRPAVPYAREQAEQYPLEMPTNQV
jgi:hypothetical protein